MSFLVGEFSCYPDLRSKFTDRSNFVNPGLTLVNGGVDMRISPQLKVVTNLSYLRLRTPTVLQQLWRCRSATRGSKTAPSGGIWRGREVRPFVNENLFFVFGFSTLIPTRGFATALDRTAACSPLSARSRLAY